MNPSDYTSIFLPFIGLEVNPGRGFDIGPLTINYYGLIIACGLLLAVLYGCKRCKQFGLSEDDLLDGVLWVTPFAILCARLYYVAFRWETYAENPISILYIWEGGLAIYGGVLGAIAGIVVFCRSKKIKVAALLDVVALGFLIGQSIGRWGNFINREAFGAATDSFFRMGLLNRRTGLWEYYHPTFLYESVWNLIGFLLLHKLSKRRRYDGQIALGYAAWYGLGRALIEGLRVDSLYWGPFRVSLVLAALSCVAAVAVLLFQSFRAHDPAELMVNHAAEASSQPETAEEEAPEQDTEEAEADTEAKTGEE